MPDVQQTMPPAPNPFVQMPVAYINPGDRLRANPSVRMPENWSHHPLTAAVLDRKSLILLPRQQRALRTCHLL